MPRLRRPRPTWHQHKERTYELVEFLGVKGGNLAVLREWVTDTINHCWYSHFREVYSRPLTPAELAKYDKKRMEYHDFKRKDLFAK